MKAHQLETTNGLTISRTKVVLLISIAAVLPFEAFVFYDGVYGIMIRSLLLGKGFAAWTLTEYIMHRWAFHDRESYGNGKVTDRYKHHHHHTHPSEIAVKKPVRYLAVIVAILGVLSIFAFGSGWVSYLLGWLSGAGAYAIMHYALHQTYAVQLFPTLVKQHIWHHLKYTHMCFGILCTFWDKLFQTVPEEFHRLPAKTIRFYYQGEGVDEIRTEQIVEKLMQHNSRAAQVYIE